MKKTKKKILFPILMFLSIVSQVLRRNIRAGWANRMAK
jgi:hypothetical protein